MTVHSNHLAKAIQIACKAHENQVDKANKPYILHPLRLMMKFENINEQIVAVLHDVIEDSETTLIDLRNAGLSDEIIDAIDALTKRPGLEYQIYLENISKNSLARSVKIEDIKDNLNLTRLQNVSDKDLERAKKYHAALQFLVNSK
ncbi:MAG: GTP pyrophosphokinase [Bacteriovorax sp.]|nr:GTP pyrophosphokinase [Bacteriovorax sp.]